jgi:hypothetical protein
VPLRSFHSRECSGSVKIIAQGKLVSDSTTKDFRTPLQANVAPKEIEAYARQRVRRSARLPLKKNLKRMQIVPHSYWEVLSSRLSISGKAAK